MSFALNPRGYFYPANAQQRRKKKKREGGASRYDVRIRGGRGVTEKLRVGEVA